MKIQIQTALEHGVLFLLDPYGEVEIPPDTGAAPVTITDTCIAFHVRDYLDGDVDVTVSNEACAGQAQAEFSGTLHVPNKVVSILDSRQFYYCMLPVLNENPRITLWRYGEESLEEAWIKIDDLDLY